MPYQARMVVRHTTVYYCKGMTSVASDDNSDEADEESCWSKTKEYLCNPIGSCCGKTMKCVCAPFKSFWEMIQPYMLYIWNPISGFLKKYKNHFSTVKFIGTNVCLSLLDVGSDINTAITFLIAGHYGWGAATLTFTILPFLVALIINFMSPKILSSPQQTIKDQWYEKWLRKAETMPKPLRYIPGFQTAYHICVAERMRQYTLEISDKKSHLEVLREKIESDSIKEIPENLNDDLYYRFRTKLGFLKYYLEVKWLYKNKDESIQQIKSNIEKVIIGSEKDISKIQSDFLRAKIYEAFLESSPQFCLQLYIIVSTGFYAGWQQMFTIITSLLSTVMVSMNIYLKMPLASGNIPYHHWKDFIFIFPIMLAIIIPRLVSLVFVASMLKHWFLAITLFGLCNLLVHRKSVKKNPEDALLGLFVSWFSSCVIKTKRKNFLVTSAMLPIVVLLIITNAAWICVSLQIQPISGLFEDTKPIYLCLPQSNYPYYKDVFKNLTSVVQCQISPIFDTNCSDTFFHEDSQTETSYGTFCPQFIDQPGFLSEVNSIMAILVAGLVLSILATIFLRWYMFSVNRYVTSYHFPLIEPLWNPDHSILEDVVNQLYVNPEKKKLKKIYQDLNEKMVKDSKKTILQLATEFGLMKLIRSSIEEFHGIELEILIRDYPEDPGLSFLGIACRTGNIETIKWIINSMNMKPSRNNDPESQEIPLQYKIHDLFFIGIGQINEIPPITVATNPALDFLLHEGDDEKWINFRYQNINETVAHLIAREGGSLDHLKKLPKESLTEPNNEGEQPIHLSSQFGHLHVVNYLLELDFNTIEAKNQNKRTPLHLASDYGKLGVMESLIKHGSDIEAKDEDERTPLHLASRYGQLDVMENLIKHGSDIEAKTYKQTSLHLAVESGHVEAVKKLLQHKANIEALGKDQRTPLLYSAEAGHIELTKILLDAGANPLAKDAYDWTALNLSAWKGHAEICDLLLKKAPSLIDALDNMKQSALHYAARWGGIEVVKLLLKHGATIDLKNKWGRTPLEIALKQNNQEVVDFLKYWKSE